MENPESDISSIIQKLTTSPPSIQQSTLETYFTNNASFTHPFCRTGSFLSLIDLLPEQLFASAQKAGRQGGIDSKWLTLMIYKWYKVLSPCIEIQVDSVAWDRTPRLTSSGGLKVLDWTDTGKHSRNNTADAGLLYVSIRQKFRIWAFIPLGYLADVRLVTVLSLTKDRSLVLDGEDGDGNGGIDGGKEKYYITHQEDLYQTSEWIKFIVPWGLGWRAVLLWQYFATLFSVLGALLLGPLTPLLEQWFGGESEKGTDKKKSIGKDR